MKNKMEEINLNKKYLDKAISLERRLIIKGESCIGAIDTAICKAIGTDDYYLNWALRCIIVKVSEAHPIPPKKTYYKVLQSLGIKIIDEQKEKDT